MTYQKSLHSGSPVTLAQNKKKRRDKKTDSSSFSVEMLSDGLKDSVKPNMTAETFQKFIISYQNFKIKHY